MNITLSPFFSLLFLLSIFFHPAAAQQDEMQSITSDFCTGSSMTQQYLEQNPSVLTKHNQLENEWQKTVNEELNKSSNDYTLPIVVHIIHEGGDENISDAMVQQGIQHLNDAFANVNYYDQETGVNTNLQFCLSKQDPSGAVSTGINRVASPLTNMSSQMQDVSLKNLIRWEPLDYINIWLVREICNSNSGCGVAGYAYFPSAHGSNIDGIVIEAGFFGSSNGNSGVIVHEMGHYLGLYHTFEGSCTNDDCLVDGDKVCDTPPDQSTAVVPCGSSVNSCSTDTDSGFATDMDDMYWNYMDYGDWDCYSAFTQGQSDRMCFFIENARQSLLESQGCNDPCLSPIMALFSGDVTLVNPGMTVNFTNNSSDATAYEWQIDGVLFSNELDSSYDFMDEGIYEITLIATNDDPNCEDVFSLMIEVRCPIVADFISSSTEITQGDAVFFNSTSDDATYYEWYLDGVLLGNDIDLFHTFNDLGNFNIQLVAGDETCLDTSALTVITVSSEGNAQTGLPIWPLTSTNETIVHAVDWRGDAPTPYNIANDGVPQAGQTGAAFNDCGDLVFYVSHTGSSNPNNLFIYKPDGSPLLTNATLNAPGLNAVRGSHELQVVPVPETSKEWYIIYNQWSSDNSAPINNAGYNLARQLYTRVRLQGDELIVEERDILLTDNNGIAHRYNDGKVVSRTVNGNINQHYLYACRRSQNDSNLSIDRFIISNTGIQFDANTGDVDAGWWYLTGAGSPMELSPTEDKLAVNNRNESFDYNDIIVFDTEDFNNSNIQIISGGDLVLVADGTANDLSSELPSSASINDIAVNSNLNLGFLNYFDRKLGNIEFSPNGRFLYIIGGGFSGSNISHLSYLAQVDLETSPLEVRLQIQTTSFDNYNPLTGSGCAYSTDPDCVENFNRISAIESSYDGNLYFTKRLDNILYVIPDPNNIMPQNLVPSELNLATTSEPNIVINSLARLLPDQIDGFNYLQDTHQAVELVVTRLDCNNNCEAPYILELSNNGILIDSFDIQNCPDTLVFCADTSLVYDLQEPISGITYSAAIVSGNVIYPSSDGVFNFSENPDCIEVCDNGIDDDNDGLIDCDDPELADDCCCAEPPVFDLGDDIIMCENGVVNLDAGEGFVSYVWHDGSTESVCTVWGPGTYWVTVVDECGIIFHDLIVVTVNLSELDLGSDTLICSGESITLSAEAYSEYEWFPEGITDCTDCSTISLTPDTSMSVILVAESDLGCISVDTIDIEVSPEYEVFDTMYFCFGDTLSVFGFDFFESGFLNKTYPSMAGCDSTLRLTVIELPEISSAIELRECEGTPIIYQGTEIPIGTTMSFPFSNEAACDSIVFVTALEPFPASEENLTFTFCSDESVMINDVIYDVFNQTGQQILPNASINGCDSIINIQLEFYPVPQGGMDVTLCEGENFEIQGQNYDSEGIYHVYFDDAGFENGCDSSLVLHISILENSVSSLDTMLCSNDFITINGEIYSVSNPTGQEVLTNYNGCDSIVNIQIEELPTPNLSIELQECEGEAIMFQGTQIPIGTSMDFAFTSSSGCDSIITVTALQPFASNDTNEAISICEGDTILIFGNPIFEEGEYSTTSSNFNGCDSVHTISLAILPSPEISFETSNTCQSQNAGTIELSVLGNEPIQYNWENLSENSPNVENLFSGNYFVTVSDANNCMATEMISIENYELIFSLEANPSCFGETSGMISVNALGSNVYSLDNQNFTTEADFSQLSSGNYEIFIEDENGCQYSDDIFLPELDEVMVEFEESEIILNLGESFQLNPIITANEIMEISWTNAQLLNCINCQNPITSPTEDVNFEITVVDANGCLATANIAIIIKRDKEVYIPNAFSPNGDGFNDVFIIYGSEDLTEIQDLKIFDRWGNMVFEASSFRPGDYHFGWNGKFKNQEMDPAVFVYVCEVVQRNGRVKVLKGDITLVR